MKVLQGMHYRAICPQSICCLRLEASMGIGRHKSAKTNNISSMSAIFGLATKGNQGFTYTQSFCALTCEHRHRNIASISLGRNVAKIAFPPFPAPPKCDAQADPPDLQDRRSSILRHLSIARQSLEWRRSV